MTPYTHLEPARAAAAKARRRRLIEAMTLQAAAGSAEVVMDESEMSMDELIAARVSELKAKGRTTKAEREELAILTYDGPRPRVLPRSDEVPY